MGSEDKTIPVDGSYHKGIDNLTLFIIAYKIIWHHLGGHFGPHNQVPPPQMEIIELLKIIF